VRSTVFVIDTNVILRIALYVRGLLVRSSWFEVRNPMSVGAGRGCVLDDSLWGWLLRFKVHGSRFDVLYIRRCRQGQPVSVALLCCQGGGLGIYLNLGFGLWLNWTVKLRRVMGKNYRGRITVDPQVHFGKPCVAGTRIALSTLLT